MSRFDMLKPNTYSCPAAPPVPDVVRQLSSTGGGKVAEAQAPGTTETERENSFG